jgi:hypothetical protein
MAFSLTIAGATPVDSTASGNGWVAIVTIAGVTNTSGTLDPTQLTLTVTDPGYTSSKTTTTRTRNIAGMKPGGGAGQQAVRRVDPNANTMLLSTNGTDLTIHIALTDRIYQGSTVTAAAITGTFYTGVSGSSATSITNSSTRPYKKAMFGWNQKHWETSGSSFAVEGLAYHREMMAGQQVACVEYTATDGTNTSAAVLVGAPTLSTKTTKGYPPEVWAASVATTALTQAASCKVNAKVYPWIGDSSAVFDTAVDGTAWPTSLPQTPLNFVNDRTGGYGTAYAYVKPGAVGGTVSGVAATAAAAPFPTLAAAMNAIPAWNNTNKGHNDLGAARIRLMDNSGANVLHTVSAAGANSPGAALFFIEKDPAAAGAVRITWDELCQMPKNFSIGGNGLIIAPTAGEYALCGQFDSREYVVVENCTVENPVDEYNLTIQDLRSFQNVTFTGTGGTRISGFGGDTVLLSGCVAVTAANSPLYDIGKVTAGNHMPYVNAGLLGGDGSEGQILANNRIYSTLFESLSALTITKGIALVQNLTETDAVRGNNGFKYFADGDLTAIDNLVVAYNTGVGERGSQMYNDTTTQVAKSGTARFNLLDNKNYKTDTFDGGNGSPGNWEWGYGTANFGELNLFGAVGRGAGDVAHNDATDPAYLGMGAHPTSEYNLFRTALGHTQADIMGYFINYTVQPRAVPALGGDYHVSSLTTPLNDRVPAGLAGLKYDLDGLARKNDGTGAAGAYEAAQPQAHLVAALSCVATGTAALTAAIRLAAAASGVVSVSAILSAQIRFASAVQARAALTAALSTGIRLAAAPAAAATLTAGLSTSIRCVAAAASQCTVTAALSTGIRLQAAAQAVTTITAALPSTGTAMAATVQAQTTVAAPLTTSIRLNAAAAGQCTVTAALTTAIRLAAGAQAVTTVSAAFVGSQAALAAAAQAQTTVTANLSTSIRLAAQVIAQAQASSAMTTRIFMVAGVQVRTTLTVDLLNGNEFTASSGSSRIGGATSGTNVTRIGATTVAGGSKRIG